MSDRTELSHGSISFEARSIPLPETISAEARAHMVMMAAPRPLPSYPPATDKDAWRRYIAAQAEMMSQMVAARAAQVSGKVETTSLNGVSVYHAVPNAPDEVRKRCVCMDLHGGALVFGGGESCKMMAGVTAERFGVQVYSVDYRMPPDHPYPAAVEDCLSVYRSLLAKFDASDIVVSGSSAGGNLAAATVLRARDEGVAMPAGVVLLTPMSDLTEAGDSFETMRDLDVVLRRRLYECGALYADGQNLKSPYISPNFADYTKGFPKTFFQTGTRDLFLSNTVLLHRAMRRAGIEADLHVWEAMPHGGFGGQSPEDRDVTAELRRFLAKCWDG